MRVDDRLRCASCQIVGSLSWYECLRAAGRYVLPQRSINKSTCVILHKTSVNVDWSAAEPANIRHQRQTGTLIVLLYSENKECHPRHQELPWRVEKGTLDQNAVTMK